MTEQTMEDALYEYYRKEDPGLNRDFFFEDNITITHSWQSQIGYNWRRSEFESSDFSNVYVAGISGMYNLSFVKDDPEDAVAYSDPIWNDDITDAEKADPNINPKDSNMCWAATDSNLMFRAGWFTSDTTDEDKVFDLYRDSFQFGSSLPGEVLAGADWYLTGHYAPVNSGVDVCSSGTGGFFSDVVTNASAYVTTDSVGSNSVALLQTAIGYLRQGRSVGLRIEPLWGGTGHFITLQGYSYEVVSSGGSSSEKITSIIIADSDNSKYVSGGSSSAPNVLAAVPLHLINGNLFLDVEYTSYMQNYWCPWKITDAIAVKPANLTRLISSAAVVREGATILTEGVGANETMHVSSGGLAMNTWIGSGGTQFVSGGGVALDTHVSSGGVQYVSEGGKTTGRMVCETGARISVDAGGIVDFRLASYDAAEGALLTDISCVHGSPTYTLTASGLQLHSDYLLAEGVDAFNKTITIVNTDGVSIGSITEGHTASICGVSCALTIDDGTRSLWLTAGSATLPDTIPVYFSGAFSNGNGAMLAKQYNGTISFYSDSLCWVSGLVLQPGWNAVGAGDFDNVGYADILCVNETTGQVVAKMSSGDGTFTETALNTKNPGWSIADIGDFDGDGIDDVLLANPTATSSSTGQYGYWKSGTDWCLIDGSLRDWELVKAGDFNGDGMDDVLWRSFVEDGNQTYESYCVKLVGVGENEDDWSLVSNTNPDTWDFLCAGDFDGDHTTDIALKNGSGDIGIWGVSDGTMSSWSNLGTAASGWTFAGVGDFNGDGTDDIAWRNNSGGQTGYWQINSLAISSWQNIATIA